MVLRALASTLTVGKSELLYTPANSLYTMKNYVEQGGESRWGGFFSATKDVVVGEAISRVFGYGMQMAGAAAGRVAGKVGEMAARRFPDATRAVTQKVKSVIHTLTKERHNPFARTASPPSVKVPKVKIGADGRMTRIDTPSTRSTVKSGYKAPAATGTDGTSIRAKSPDPSKQTNIGRSRSGAKRAGLEINEKSFEPAGKPPALDGVPSRDNRAIKVVADKYGVKAYFRPTNPASRRLLESNKAYPKPEMLKSKTINKLDVELGFPKDKIGTVACKRPVLPPKKPPGMSKRHWRELKGRYAQRNAEFLDQQAELNQLVNQKTIKWDKKTGSITSNDGKNMPFAGDHDAFAFVDARTGEPVSEAVNNRINRELQSMGATSHSEHVGWDYSKASRDIPRNAPKGAKSPFKTKAGIDQKILNGHSPGGEPLNTYDPRAAANSRDDWSVRSRRSGEQGWRRASSTKEEGWSTSYWNGGLREFQ